MKNKMDALLNNKRPKRERAGFLLVGTVLINVMIPKAGIKIAGIPITLGLLFAVAMIMLFVFTKGIYRGRLEVGIVVSCVFWLFRLFLGFISEENASLSEFVALSSVLVAFPFLWFCVKNGVNTDGKFDDVIKILDVGTTIIMIYAVLQFIFGIGRVDVPGVTVNWTDWFESPDRWWLEKYNQISGGGVKSFQLIKTEIFFRFHCYCFSLLRIM